MQDKRLRIGATVFLAGCFVPMLCGKSLATGLVTAALLVIGYLMTRPYIHGPTRTPANDQAKLDAD